MKNLKITILFLAVTLVFFTGCKKYDNNLNGTTWQYSTGSSIYDTVETYVFNGTNGGTYTIKVPVTELNADGTSAGKILRDTTYTNSNIGYTYSENHETVSVSRQLTSSITGSFTPTGMWQAGSGDCTGGSTMYSGTLIGNEMTLTRVFAGQGMPAQVYTRVDK